MDIILVYLSGAMVVLVCSLKLIKMGYGQWIGATSDELGEIPGDGDAWDAFFIAVFWPIFVPVEIFLGFIVILSLFSNYAYSKPALK